MPHRLSGWGKSHRLAQLSDADGAYFLLALDHGLSAGAIDGLLDTSHCVQIAEEAKLTGVVLTRGSIEFLQPQVRLPIVLQTMGLPDLRSTGDPIGFAPRQEPPAQGVLSLDRLLGQEYPDRRQVLLSWPGPFCLPVPQRLVPDSDGPGDLLPGETKIHAALGQLLSEGPGLSRIALWMGPRSLQRQMAKGQRTRSGGSISE